LVKLAKKGLVDIAAVGNEVMYRKDLSEEELLDFIYKVKKQIPKIKVGYVDAYYEFSHRPKITEACDVILCNCYPFWEGCPFENSLDYMKQMYHQAVAAGDGKEVIITETGWPSEGENLRGALPGMEHARNYFINTQLWSSEDHIPVFYFSSFDESWKVGTEGVVGAYWGIWDKNEKLKF
jgi:exo-beta-1,3-glucanase (GH17 family)